MSLNYNQYLGARRCCDLKVQGPQGPQGYQGPSAVGQRGATGASQWSSMNGVGSQGAGYTGIGVTGQDVLIYGNLLVTGGIDPIYLALTPQPSGPQGFANPLWVDSVNGNALRSEKILLSDVSNNVVLDPTSIIFNNLTGATTNTISNTGGYDMTISSSSQLVLNSTDNTDINADDNISLNSSGLGDIRLNAPNVVSYGYAMPICFTRERTAETFTYNLANQNWENVYNVDFNIPYQFTTETPQSGYISTTWKIDFALNCYRNTNLGDTGIALYIEFDDISGNHYTPMVYNLLTPYAVNQPTSSFSNSAAQPFQNFNWSDLVNLSGLEGSGINVPLTTRLYFAGDSIFTCNFNIAITLTRTNLV